MINQRAFGRRTIPQPQPLRAGPKPHLPAPEAKPAIADMAAEHAALLQREILFPQASEDWRGKDQAIKPKFKVPWRQVALMASLCFGIASFVLPDTINDDLDWLLYGLMAISAYVGLSKRFLKS